MRTLTGVVVAAAVLVLSGCNCSSGSGKDAGSCTAGLACTSNPGGPCKTGKTACGPEACVDGPVAAAGTSCGALSVCNGSGSCVACAAGSGCGTNPGGPCVAGVMECASGTPLCSDGAAVAAGTACGAGQVCDGNGGCVACASGAACTTNAGAPCIAGAIDCASGAPVCADGTRVAAGTACGADQVCDGDGGCVACAASSNCSTNPGGACVLGQLQCGSGGPVCADAAPVQAGAACGTGQVCDGNGACIGCVAGAACGDECGLGQLDCSTGAPVCQATPVADGTPCDAGVCALGACAISTVVSGTVNLSQTALTPGRSCAESPAFPVTALAASSATVDPAPSPGCLDPGDEVLLVDLQGMQGAVDNVGTWETLQVAQVSGATVTFAGTKSRFYGASAGSDLGLGDGGQKVVLVRVPSFGALVVDDAGVLTADPWDGTSGGVVALRAATLDLKGRISAEQLGYRGGDWSRDVVTCTENLLTGAGESIGGPGTESLDANYGGSGGMGASSVNGFVNNVPTSPSPGHAQAGEPGANYNGRAEGEPGFPYGSGDGGTLTLGSGSGGNLTCDSTIPALMLIPGFPSAGGIIFVRAGRLTMAGGAISADGVHYDSRVTSSGGSVMLRGDQLELDGGLVSALGGVAEPLPGLSPGNTASPGYVSVFYKTSVSGTTQPPAFEAQVPSP